jgi:uroporphyrinogen-III synthase
MPDYSKHILCTRPVSKKTAEEALTKNIGIDIIPFIETTAIETIEVQQEVELAANETTTVVFTSMNAVDAVTALLDGYIPEWRIYCMGHKTKELVDTYFGENRIADTAENAADLADRIIETAATDEVIFFCGNQRRDELPAKLRKENIDVTEITVYQTEYIQHRIDKIYDGILFFSPSAVESFFMQNTLPDHTIVFAIGQTTKETVQRNCKNKIIVSKQPGKDELVQEAITYFTRQSETENQK